VKGKVTKLASFGAFVEIEEGLEGLLHVSEISEKKVDKPEDVLQMEQELELKVINVDAKERKIGLSLKAAQMPDEEAEEKYDFASYADAGPGGATLGAVAGGALEKLAARAEAREAAAAEAGEKAEAESEEAEKPEAPPEEAKAEEEKPEAPPEEAEAEKEKPEAPPEEDKPEEEKAEDNPEKEPEEPSEESEAE
jgi:small subunit ribosomal protein S1